MADPARLPPLPFAEAIAWARARQVVLPQVYYGELTALARSQAFTISGLTALDQVEAVRDSLAEVLETGATFRDWQTRVVSGELPIDAGPARLETIFRNNIQQSYNRGRYEQQARTADTLPYLMYDAVDDSRTRPTHAAMDGYVARRGDPVWSTWTPACGHRCRCRRIALSAAQAERYIVEDAERLGDPERATARAESIQAGPDPGWGYDPYQDPNAGLRAAIEQRERDCGAGLAARFARRRRGGGCSDEAVRLLAELRERQERGLVVAERERVLQHLDVAATLAASADRWSTVWAPGGLARHLSKRISQGHVRDQADYAREVSRTLIEADVVLAAASTQAPLQIAVESADWAIIYTNDLLTTAYRKEAGGESFIVQRARLGRALWEVPLDDELRGLLRRLRGEYARLAAR